MLRIRAVGVEDWQVWRGLRLRALEEAPYAFGSRFTEWQDAPEERWRARLTEVPLNLVGDYSGQPAGMTSLTAVDDAGDAELISMWVAPEARGRGMGDALISSAVSEARRARAHRVVLWVVQDNRRAEQLYRRHGFHDVLVDGRPRLEDGERFMALPL
ncbi:MAG TPA: GNAT family N-acetyltransferase [Motilibacteraceae bacterium]|nr:GNAT family N-acetyltransferase [Motilibacteraceae bacterium]